MNKFIPVITLPLGYTMADMEEAKKLVKEIADGTKDYVVLPPGWEFKLEKK